MPAPQITDRGYTIRIDPGKTANFYRQLRDFSPKLTAALRRRIRNAGRLAVNAVIKELEKAREEAGATSGPLDPESLQALINATKVTISFTPRGAGAKIRTGQQMLAAGHQGIAFAYNLASFRHPVFESEAQFDVRLFSANRRRGRVREQGENHDLAGWVTQKGHPFFGVAIDRIISTTIQAEVEAAFADAAKASGLTAPF